MRPPAVAGLFYPESASVLAAMVDELLEAAGAGAAGRPAHRSEPGPGVPKALIVPHAGYVYSGSTAALGYAAWWPVRDDVRRVVLLGPTHRVAAEGLVTPGADAMDTPLGRVTIEAIDPNVAARLPQLGSSAVVHELEHSLEVQLPFLQRTLVEFTVVPLAVGWASPDQVAAVIEALWGGPETVVVVSSDLSHYLSYDEANAIDAVTVDQILSLDGPITHEQACGATPANGLLVAAARHGLTPRLLGRCNSGDTAGDKRRVVGYAAVAFDEPRAG